MVKESIAEKNEREGKEAGKMKKEKEGALVGLGKMFSEEEGK